MAKMTITTIISMRVNPLLRNKSSEFGVRSSEFACLHEAFRRRQVVRSPSQLPFKDLINSFTMFSELLYGTVSLRGRSPSGAEPNRSLPNSSFRLMNMENSSPPSHHRVNLIRIIHRISHTNDNPFISSISYEIGG